MYGGCRPLILLLGPSMSFWKGFCLSGPSSRLGNSGKASRIWWKRIILNPVPYSPHCPFRSLLHSPNVCLCFLSLECLSSLLSPSFPFLPPSIDFFSCLSWSFYFTFGFGPLPVVLGGCSWKVPVFSAQSFGVKCSLVL